MYMYIWIGRYRNQSLVNTCGFFKSLLVWRCSIGVRTAPFLTDSGLYRALFRDPMLKAGARFWGHIQGLAGIQQIQDLGSKVDLGVSQN